MRKQRIEYDSSVDALVAIAKHLSRWANDYKHYVAIRRDIEDQLHNVA